MLYHVPNSYKSFFFRLSKEERVQTNGATNPASQVQQSCGQGQRAYGDNRSGWTEVQRERLNKLLLAGKIKNTPSTCKQNELPALIPRDAALQLYIHLPLGPWPWLRDGARVNEAENTPRAAGCQARSKGGASLLRQRGLEGNGDKCGTPSFSSDMNKRGSHKAHYQLASTTRSFLGYNVTKNITKVHLHNITW